jgi:hypothetical protein
VAETPKRGHLRRLGFAVRKLHGNLKHSVIGVRRQSNLRAMLESSSIDIVVGLDGAQSRAAMDIMTTLSYKSAWRNRHALLLPS